MRLLLLFITLASSVSSAQLSSVYDSSLNIGDVITIHNIRWDFDRYELDSSSFPILDSITSICESNPNIVLKIGVHSDTRYSDKYSRCLTCKRAQSITNYLISKGIASDRLISIGYNDAEPLISEQEIEELVSPEEIEKAHAYNRRVTLKIIDAEYHPNN